MLSAPPVPELKLGWEVVIVPAAVGLLCLLGGLLLLRSRENRQRVGIWIGAGFLLLVGFGIGTCCVLVLLG